MPSNERSAEFCRGAVAVLGRMVDECSTVFDSDLPHITQGNLEDYLAEYAELLAAAEAREATQPTAAELIEACLMAITELCELANSNGDVFDYQIENRTEHARAKLARWKEANGG